MSQRWYSFTQNDGVLDVFIANKISDSAQSIAPLLVAVEASNKIQITIDSLGGEGHAAWQLGSALAEKEASCLVIGNCQSAAVQIVVGCRPVRALETAVFMIHSPYIRLCGTLAQAILAVGLMRENTNHYEDLLVSQRGIGRDLVHSWLTEGEHYFSAHQAVEAHLIDDVVSGTTSAATADRAPVVQAALDALQYSGPKFSMSECQLLEFLNEFLPFRPVEPEAFYTEMNRQYARLIIK